MAINQSINQIANQSHNHSITYETISLLVARLVRVFICTCGKGNGNTADEGCYEECFKDCPHHLHERHFQSLSVEIGKRQLVKSELKFKTKLKAFSSQKKNSK